MQCPECQFDNPDGIKFCGECGSSLVPLTKDKPKKLTFEEKLDKIQRYLPKGLTEKILSQRDKIEGEHKQVTVMFCDMEGFTSFVERLGSEEAYEIMDKVYEILIHKVRDFEGTVNEMTGDGIMGLFGAPIALEDAPKRALWTALSIHNTMSKFSEQNKDIESIKMRIGIHTGPVVVGALGNDLRVEFKAVGDTVNLASRMEGLADSGTTYVTEETYKLTEKLFQFEDLGKKTIKGKSKAVHVYKLLSAKKDIYRPRLGFERMIYSEMVGRTEELNMLELHVMRAINGEGSIVSIIGEAGIGKSRLIAELKNSDIIKKVALLEGRSISVGKNLSFHPIIDLLKRWSRIEEIDSERTALNKLEKAVRDVDPKEFSEVFPFIATLMGMNLPGRYAEKVKGIESEAMEKVILKHLRTFLSKASKLRPLVIVMEDLHWADMSSVELVVSLYRIVETQRIIFINVLRPEYKDTGGRIIEILNRRLAGHHFEIQLGPLDEKMSEILINNMYKIKWPKHSVVDKIIDRAGGNPFFIEEVMRSFIDEGAIIAKSGTFEVTEKIDSMFIPHTINDVLMARIDRLEVDTRNLLKVASVIGRSFFYRILTGVAKKIEDIDSRLLYLKDIQIIRERRRLEELEFLFKHALAQEATYESILVKKRKEIHLSVADSIEEIFNNKLNEFYGILAFHYSKGENLDKAEEYMIKAGEEALRSTASREALNYYRDALSLYLKKFGKTANNEKITTLEKNIAIAFYNKGEYTNALIYFDRVLNRLGIKPPQNKILILTKLLFDLMIISAKLSLPIKKNEQLPKPQDSEVFQLCYKKVMTLVMVNPMRCFAETIGTIRKSMNYDLRKMKNGYLWPLAGSGATSISGLSFKLSRKFLTYAERVIDKKNFKEIFTFNFYKLFHDCTAGNWENIQGYSESLLNQNLKVGQFQEATANVFFTGLVRIEKGDFIAAYAIMEKLHQIYDDYDFEHARCNQLMMESYLCIQSRKIDDIYKTIDKLEDSINKIGSDLFRLTFLGYKALSQILMNDYDLTKKSIDEAEEYSKILAEAPPLYLAPVLLAKFSYNLIMLEDSIQRNDKLLISRYKKLAYQSSQETLKSAKRYAVFSSAIYRLSGNYFLLINKERRAIKNWLIAIDNCEHLGARPDLARTYMEIGKCLTDKNSGIHQVKDLDGLAYIQKARSMFQEMKLQRDIDELDKIAF